MQDNFNSGVTSYGYDANSNLTQEEFTGTGTTPAMRIDQSYDAANQLTDVNRYSDIAGTTKVATSSHVYDAAGELTNEIDKNGTGGGIANTTNVYDAASRITSEQVNGAAPTTYSYDAANELTGDGVTSPVYDATGNRTGSNYTVGSGNELTADPTWKYSYDAAGEETKAHNISSGNTWVYGYDPKGELTQAQLYQYDPATYGTGDPILKEVDYKYDAFGQMSERDDYPTGTGNPIVTRYAVDGWDPALAGATGTSNFNVWAELSSTNALQTRYFHGKQVDQLFGRQDSLIAYWYQTDRLGSVRDVLDNSGTVKDALSYDGWGNIASESNNAYRGNYAWTGRQFDVETDLQYNRARWYDPATGRWQTQDPLGFDAGDSNLYRYVRNAPTAFTDPSGRITIVMEICYYSGNNAATELTIDASTIKETDRIFRAAVLAKAKAGSKLIINWFQRTEGQLNAMKTRGQFGWVPTATNTPIHGPFLPYLVSPAFGCVYNLVTPVTSHSTANSTSLRLLLDQGPPNMFIHDAYGEGANFQGVLYKTSIINDQRIPRNQRSLFVGLTIAHELGFHAIAHGIGHINAAGGPFIDDEDFDFRVGIPLLGKMVFSPAAATEFVHQLKLDR